MKYLVIPMIGGTKEIRKTFFEYCESTLSFGSDIPSKGFYFSIVNQVENAALSLGWNGIFDDCGNKLISSIKTLWSEYNGGSLEYILNLIKYNQEENNSLFNYYFIECQNDEDVDIFVEHFNLSVCKTIIFRNDDITLNFNNMEFYDFVIMQEEYTHLFDMAKKFIYKIK